MEKLEFVLNKQTLPVVEQMAAQLPGGFVLYQENETRDILFINQGMLDIYECDSVEEFRALTGYSFHGMVHPEDQERVQSSIDAQIEGKYGSYDHVEYRIVTKKGTVRWIDDYGHFSHSQDYGDVFFVFLFDITDKILAQEAENRFFSDMSHQLLTPMNAVSTFIKLALKHKDEPEALAGYLRSADEAAKNMVERIDQMVEIHRQPSVFRYTARHRKKQGPVRVLVAEDNELNRLLLQTILEEADILVEAVDDGDKAVQAVWSHEPGYYDVVLMDIQMNAMDGHEAARQIRLIPYANMDELPILAVSANSRQEDIQESMRSGMNEHMAKPYDPEKIVSAVLRFAGREREE